MWPEPLAPMWKTCERNARTGRTGRAQPPSPDHQRERPRLGRLGSAGDAGVEVLDARSASALVDRDCRGRRGRARGRRRPGRSRQWVAMPSRRGRPARRRCCRAARERRRRPPRQEPATDCAGVADDRAERRRHRGRSRRRLAGVGQAPSDPAAHVAGPTIPSFMRWPPRSPRAGSGSRARTPVTPSALDELEAPP